MSEETEQMMSAQRRVLEAAVAFARARNEERSAWHRARGLINEHQGTALKAVRVYTQRERELAERCAELLSAVESLRERELAERCAELLSALESLDG